MNKIEEILNSRESSHGDYGVQSKITEGLKDVLLAAGYKELPWYVRNALDLICTKIGRMVAGDYKHADHYDDISGYAQLAKKEIVKDPSASISEKIAASENVLDVKPTRSIYPI